jgi:hypothetical protein
LAITSNGDALDHLAAVLPDSGQIPGFFFESLQNTSSGGFQADIYAGGEKIETVLLNPETPDEKMAEKFGS